MGRIEKRNMHVFSLFSYIYMYIFVIYTHAWRLELMPANQKRREKTQSSIKKKKHTDWSDDSCGWLCFKDPINLIQLHEVFLQFSVGEGMFPYALPFGYCLLVRLPLFCWEDHCFHFPPTGPLPDLNKFGGWQSGWTGSHFPPPDTQVTTTTGMVAHVKDAEHCSDASEPQKIKLPATNKQNL